MKQPLLLLLTCGMFVSAFSQPEVSDKWVITPVTTMKGVLGRLDINFPADIERNILIYQQADNKFLRSVSHNDKIYTIAPGEYRFTLTNVPVENVPIKKGHETRLKAGFLDIVSEGDWHLYDETKAKAYTSGNKPKKLPLPVGRYQIKLGGQFYPVIIKDGETVEDYTPVEIAGIEPPISDNISETFFGIDAENYTMTRVPAGEDTAMQTKGRLAMKFPLASRDAFFAIISVISIYKSGENSSLVHECYVNFGQGTACPQSHTLDEGVYDVKFGVRSEAVGAGNPLKVANVSIRKGFETRLKVGYLSHPARGLYQMYDSSRQSQLIHYVSQGSALLPLPIGSYWLHLAFVGEFPVTIKDGEASSFRAIDTNHAKIKTIHSKILKEKPISINGRLNTSFPEDTSLSIYIRLPNPNSSLGYDVVHLDTVKIYDLLPGNYKVYLNYMLVEVTIRPGQETKIRFGYLVTSSGSWKLTGSGQNSTGGKRKKAFPIGYYNMLVSNYSYLIKITEGETMVFQL